ncbi:Na+ dependent nucleoside transporter C-terminus-domain-containing protein [Catenaria anguillulae PL171]|uniref:Na+ dependent nucleoside transporter C-terminus-domain-containing protein n=1 Tax=Catenaria anguillulae PL171 TaxID=765915 RepID=A0A1Y2I1D1_9FUNG|nr:Na+ dependent nucleoside transporter C-terminus-domain-containing protein [Catenaria anguillulae PL171]
MSATEEVKADSKVAAPQPAQPETFKDSTLQRVVDAVICIGLTVWLIFAWGNHPDTIAFPAFLYFCIIAKIGTKRISNETLSKPFAVVFGPISSAMSKFSDNIWAGVFFAATLAIAIVSILVIPDSEAGSKLDRARSLLGLILIIVLVYACSNNRAAVDFRLVSVGILAQFLLGLFVLKTTFGNNIFSFISKMVAGFLGLGKNFGLKFLWFDAVLLQNFIVNVLPAIIFFASFIQVVYYLGAMQWLVIKFAWVMVRLMNTSGSESVVAAASPFVGQGESALMVLPFLEFMTESEIHTIMASGFSTIAGSVLFAFLSMGIDGTALITSCIMSVPCSLALSKLRWPETEASLSKGDVTIPDNGEHHEVNVLHAAANGAAQGMTLAGLITGSLLSIIALYNLCDIVFTEFFRYLNPSAPISINRVLGYVFWPFAWALGVPIQDCTYVGQLLGMKMVINEFAAYDELSFLIGKNAQRKAEAVLSKRGELLATYALCGFANIGSVGIQIGCLGAMAPSRRGDIAKIAVPAMLVGTMCTLCSACIAGILL